MTDEIAQKAGELYKRKSELSKDISNLLGGSISLAYNPGGDFLLYYSGPRALYGLTPEMKDIIKETTIYLLEKELEVVEKELNQLNS